MLNLNEVLNNEKIQDRIEANLFTTRISMVLAIVATAKSKKFNCTSVRVVRDNEFVLFENTLWYSEDKDEYLLESRVFKEDGSMINGYLEILNSKGDIIADNYQDDVWAYTNWIEVKEEV